ncbi:hypothetical protein, partial [Roseinatronobacter sp. NSM]|uniref:hypothetical protein n=1 Tax=Roseinatronobacter sp. NSM TaxID=3457785 RepID=UPI0040370979
PEADVQGIPQCGAKAAGRRAIGGPSRGLPIPLVARQALKVGICRLHKVNFTGVGSADPGPPTARALSMCQRLLQTKTSQCAP